MPLSPAGCPWIRLSEHQQRLHPFTPRPPSLGMYSCEFENVCSLGNRGFQGCFCFLIYSWAVKATRLWYTGTQGHEAQRNQFCMRRCIYAHTRVCSVRYPACLFFIRVHVRPVFVCTCCDVRACISASVQGFTARLKKNFPSLRRTSYKKIQDKQHHGNNYPAAVVLGILRNWG